MGGIKPGEGDSAETDPPLTVELLADLQAGLLDDDAAARLRKKIRADPDAQQMVHALNRVRCDVAAAGTDLSATPAVAPAVIDGIGAALRAAPIAARQSRAHLHATHTVRPSERLRRGRALAAAAGLAATALAAGLGIAALIATPAPAPAPSGSTTAQRITVSRPPMQIPLSDPQIVALLNREPDYGPLADPQRRASCLGGLGYPAATQVLSAQPIEIAGHAAVLLVLSSRTPGKVTALAVAPTCSSLNTGLLADRVVNRP
jgi:hypothetical protein